MNQEIKLSSQLSILNFQTNTFENCELKIENY